MAEEEKYDPGRCSPCRGTGKVISTAGGKTEEITCPWCEGSGRRPQPEPASPEE